MQWMDEEFEQPVKTSTLWKNMQCMKPSTIILHELWLKIDGSLKLIVDILNIWFEWMKLKEHKFQAADVHVAFDTETENVFEEVRTIDTSLELYMMLAAETSFAS